jgi:hypothetical protein
MYDAGFGQLTIDSPSSISHIILGFTHMWLQKNLENTQN